MTQTTSLDTVVEQVVVGGDLSALSSRDRLNYYNAICKSVGLNPLTRPFDYLHLGGKLVLYAKRDATDQLRKRHGVSIERLEKEYVEGVYTVTAYARDAQGRVDSSIGAVPIEGLKGEARANAIMKCETKSKRRVTLSICGLGMLDETEIASVPDARPVVVDHETGEVHPTPAGPPVWAPGDPAPDEAAERAQLLNEVSRLATALGWRADKRAAAWAQYCPGADPRTVDLPSLHALLEHLQRETG
jgi:hypothetical protein